MRGGIVGIVVSCEAAVDGLAEQRDQVVSDVTAGTAFLKIVGGDGSKAQGIIQFSEGQQSGVGGDGSTTELEANFGVEVELERGLFAVTIEVPPICLRN